MENETVNNKVNDEVAPVIDAEAPREGNEAKPSAGGSTFYKQKLAEAEAEKAKLLAKMEAIQTEKLQEKENFKELWELEKEKRTQAEEKAQKIATNYFNGLKSSAIKQEALKAGILESAVEDLEMLDSSLVEVETTDKGSVNIIGAKEFIEQLKERRSHWFKKSGAPTININNPGEVKTKVLTASELVKLQKTDPARYKEEMKKKFNIA